MKNRKATLAATTRTLVVAFGLSLTMALPATASDLDRPALTLYGIKLKGATLNDFVAAAQAAGAIRLSTKPGAAVYDVAGTRVPGLQKFTLINDGADVVAVQFDVDGDNHVQETLRKMLVSKYRMPNATTGTWPGPDERFDGEYVGEGTYVWRFEDGMRLAFKRTFFGQTTLTYTDAARFDALMTRIAAQTNEKVVRQAATVSSNF